MCCSYVNFWCWIHFCRMPSCKWYRFSTNRKIQNGWHRTSAIHIFVIFVYIVFCLEPLIYRNIFKVHCFHDLRHDDYQWNSICNRKIVGLSPPRGIYICCIVWQFDTWSPSIESKMAKKLIRNIKLKRAIDPNPLWQSRHIRFPRKLFSMGLSLWYMNKKKNALAPPNELALIAWTKLQVFVQGFTNK